MSRATKSLMLALLVVAASSACGTPVPVAAPVPAPLVTPAEVMTLLIQLSHDSLRGRRTGSPGATKAAAMIAREMQRLGLEPAGDSGYFQRVGLYRVTDTTGRVRLRLASSWAAFDSIPTEQRIWAVNVVGRLSGSEPQTHLV